MARFLKVIWRKQRTSGEDERRRVGEILTRTNERNASLRPPLPSLMLSPHAQPQTKKRHQNPPPNHPEKNPLFVVASTTSGVVFRSCSFSSRSKGDGFGSEDESEGSGSRVGEEEEVGGDGEGEEAEELMVVGEEGREGGEVGFELGGEVGFEGEEEEMVDGSDDDSGSGGGADSAVEGEGEGEGEGEDEGSPANARSSFSLSPSLSSSSSFPALFLLPLISSINSHANLNFSNSCLLPLSAPPPSSSSSPLILNLRSNFFILLLRTPL